MNGLRRNEVEEHSKVGAKNNYQNKNSLLEAEIDV
jgi:hypothetical protein